MDNFGHAHFAQLRPSAPAVIESRGRTWSRGELHCYGNKLSRALQSRGLVAGDVLAIVAPNCIEYLATYLAATQIGLYVVPINWHLSAAEIAYILADCGAKAVVVHERLSALMQGALSGGAAAGATLLSIGAVPGFSSFDDILPEHSDAPLESPVGGRVMMYTSATTGKPKAIALPLGDALVALERTIRYHISLGVLPESGHVHLCASMLYHSAPLEASAIALHMGHTVVLVDRWDAESLLRLIAEHSVSTSFMVPTMFVRFLKLPRQVRERYSVRSLRLVAHAAAPCPLEVKREMIEWWGPVLWESYGAAEGAGTIVSSQEWLQYPGTVGKPIPGSRVKILNDAGEEQPAGAVGTIYLTRYTGDRFEYRGDPEKTRSAYRGDFFTAGDIGYMNEDGFLFICDRKIDMIITGGMNIYSAEIERVLVQHPRVADCAVFGIPDELMGESVKAVIQALPNVVPDSELTTDILRFLGQRLSPVKMPRRVEYVSELPRDPNGKLYKRRLRDPHWEGYDRKV